MVDPNAPKRRMEVVLHDAHVGLWQDNPNDPTLRTEIFDGALAHLKRRGFKITADPRVAKHHRRISPNYRLAARGDMRAEIHVSGRVVQFEWWSEAARADNPNGGRYDFNRRARMPYLDGLRFDLEVRHLMRWLAEHADIVPRAKGRRDVRAGLGRGEVTAAEYVRASYEACWHTDKALGRPRAADYNRQSGDGSLIDHGARVWFRDRKGRILAGIAHYSLNNQWMIVTGPYHVAYASSGEIYTRCPADLRVKRNARERRKRLEGELAKAIQRMSFLRAETLRKILFGSRLTYGIWAADKEAFYCADYAGYTSDSIRAGRYTWDEAAKEVRRVPHELRLVLPDGRRLKASELDRAMAA